MLLLDQAPDPPPKTTVFAAYVAVPEIHNGEVPDTEAIEAFGLTTPLTATFWVVAPELTQVTLPFAGLLA
jgi:hypothetical protein